MRKIIVLIVSFMVMSIVAAAEEYERVAQCINAKDSHCSFSISLYKDMESPTK